MRLKTTPHTVLSQAGGRRESASLASLRLRAALLVVSLLAYIPVALLAAWAASSMLPAMAQPEGKAPLADQPELLKLMPVLFGVVFLLTIIFFCCWIWRVARTVRRLGITVLVERPGSAVLVFFLPVIWWWQPYTVVRTFWQVATDPNDWDNVAISQALPLWWTAWIGQWIALLAGLGIEWAVMGPEKRFLETSAMWIFAGCGVVSALCLLAIVLQTTAGLSRQLRNRQPVS